MILIEIFFDWARIGHEQVPGRLKSPITSAKSGMENLTLNQWVPGSSPGGRTSSLRSDNLIS